MSSSTLKVLSLLGCVFALVWGLIAVGCASRICFLFRDLSHPLAWPLVSVKVVLIVLLVLWAFLWALIGEIELIYPSVQEYIYFSYVFSVFVANGIKPISVILFCAIMSTRAIGPVPTQSSHDPRRTATCHNASNVPRGVFRDVVNNLVPMSEQNDCRENPLSPRVMMDLIQDVEMTPCHTDSSKRFNLYVSVSTDTHFPSRYHQHSALTDISNHTIPSPRKIVNGERENILDAVPPSETSAQRVREWNTVPAASASPGNTPSGASSFAQKVNTFLCFVYGNIPDDVMDAPKGPTRWASLLRWRLLLGLRHAACCCLIFLLLSVVFSVLAFRGEVRNCDERASETLACKINSIGTGERRVYMPRTLTILSLSTNALLLILWTDRGIVSLEQIGNAVTKKSFQRTFIVGALQLATLTLYDCVLLFETLRYNALVTRVIHVMRNLAEGQLLILLALRLGSGTRDMPQWYTLIESSIFCSNTKLGKSKDEFTVL